MESNDSQPQVSTGDVRLPVSARLRRAAPEMLLLFIILAAAYLRFVGLNWDDYTHIHPDERFLTMVESSIQLPDSIGGYFNTDASPLNPHNQHYDFFVYGTLPIFLVRVVAGWIGQTGYDQIHLVGRFASAFFDLISVFLVYLVGEKLYRRRVGLVAAALAACAVLLIQQAHFFTVDSFANTFVLLGLYFAVRVMDGGRLLDYLGFGAALGMAMASKINTVALAGVIVLAVIPRIWSVAIVDRDKEFWRAFRGLVLAAVVAFVFFRICQPYAFSGPSFFGIGLNPKWVANIREQRAQAGGNVDMPPNLQWANRTPVLFSLRNMVEWGLGLPLGIVAWLGWGWALLRMIRGDWRRHLIPVVWTGAYFIWQSISFNPSMRYELPVYPMLIVLAAWGMWEAWDRAKEIRIRWRQVAQIGAAAAGVGVLLATSAWAFAFVSIYTRPVTRVAASRWIYTNLPGVVNLVIQTDQGKTVEPIPVPADPVVIGGDAQTVTFHNDADGQAQSVSLPIVTDLTPELGPRTLRVEILADPLSPSPLGTGLMAIAALPGDNPIVVPLDAPVDLQGARDYALRITAPDGGAFRVGGSVSISVEAADGVKIDNTSLPSETLVVGSTPGQYSFISHQDGTATAVLLPKVRPVGGPGELALHAEILMGQGSLESVARGSYAGPAPTLEGSVEIPFDHPFQIAKQQNYMLTLGGTGGIPMAARGSVIVSESTWDDGLPLRMEDGLDIGGRYTGVNQELYWQDDQDDNHNGVPDKLERIVNTLSQGDILAISSNRQYGTIPRVPVRYPLTTAYYRALVGCPPPSEILDCMAHAQPGNVHGQLGYDLVAVFENDPTLGPLKINDQKAEEAFTVYDHPKVLIFAKTAAFSADKVRALLSAVDLSQVVHLLPNEVSAPPKDLMLPPDRLQEERNGGTWSQLYPRDSLINRSQVVAVVAWWLLIALLGILAFPLTRAALPGLHDAGYPVARIVGLLVVAWASWALASLQVHFTPVLLAAMMLLLGAVSALLAWRDWDGLVGWVRSHLKEIAWVEVLALAFFLLDLGIRFANPDLWHPAKGGEKPMDFSYLNAILKSTSFPPYDPWFAGGTINYYYFGFVLIAVPIKLLGLIPATAYNLAIPTIFALLALAGYCVARNLVARTGESFAAFRRIDPRLAGAAAAVALVLLGNLGTVSMIYEGLKRLGTPPGETTADGLAGTTQAVRGLGPYLTLEATLPYGLDSWYWDPSRAIPPGEGEAGPITEFPFFTFLYADLHAHMISRLLTVLGLAWMLSWLMWAETASRRRWVNIVASLLLGGLALGALYPTNLGDYPTYWGLGALATAGAALVRHRRLSRRAAVEAGGAAVALLALSYLLFLPFHQWYAAGYGAVDLWKGSRTPLGAYLVVHGLFLFVLVSWMAWEARQWMAATPISALGRLRPAAGLLVAAAIVLIGSISILFALGYSIAPVVGIIIVWASLLFLRPGQPLEKRLVLALIAVGTALTFLVEVVVVRGDISRMNTVFKFYLQVWEMFAIGSAAAVYWLICELPAWRPNLRRVWSAGLALLVFGAALYPLTAAQAKMRDRWVDSAPHTLDGMAFMPYATYYDLGASYRLDEDYRAIQWMQDNVRGSPVIVEANIPEYRWGSRFTIYTGLPGVLGWNWHQRQQRAVIGDQVVTDRALAITDFYLTRSIDEAVGFLRQYTVRYVIVGGLERMYYERVQPCLDAGDGQSVTCNLSGWPMGMPNPNVPPSDCSPLNPGSNDAALVCPTHGLEKFQSMVSQGLLKVAHQDGSTVIYEVVQ
jgi:YYY domain-containing protein